MYFSPTPFGEGKRLFLRQVGERTARGSGESDRVSLGCSAGAEGPGGTAVPREVPRGRVCGVLLSCSRPGPCNCPRAPAASGALAGAARVVQWLGRISSAEPGGTIGDGQRQELIPGCCRGADVAWGWSTGACSHPQRSEQLAGGGWVRAPASPGTCLGRAPCSWHGEKEGCSEGRRNEGHGGHSTAP